MNKISFYTIGLMSFLSITLYANKNAFEQFTPNQANWKTFETKPFANGVNRSHDPDGVSWIKPATWEAAKWNGTE